MRIDKAIEILALDVKGNLAISYQDWQDALKLGIEALKRIKACREPEGGSPLPPLSGEMPEGR